MDLGIQERNKVRDRKRSKRRVSSTVVNVELKRPKYIKCYSAALARESQNIGFHRERSGRQDTSMASTGGSRRMKVLVCNDYGKNNTRTCSKVTGGCYKCKAQDHYKRDCLVTGGNNTEHFV